MVKKTGTVITFYSYKGGVGRSMALANIGSLLTSWGNKVLLIDWDLEAPGLENYFKEYIKLDVSSKKEGLINLLLRRKKQPDYSISQIDWDKCLIHIPTPIDQNQFKDARLDLLTAGVKDDNYIKNVKELDYDKFYDENNGGHFLEELREHWISQYDFVFIDSRTGLTDSSGICSIQMPDILVMLFTATEQGFAGTLDVAKRAVIAQEEIVYDRFRLKLLPVPTRFDATEFKLQQEWLGRFTEGLKSAYETWVPDYPNDKDINISHRNLLELTKLPYVPYFSYGEKLPVFEQGTNDPQSLGYAYETIAALLTHKLEGAKLLTENRSEYVKRAKENLSPYDNNPNLNQVKKEIKKSFSKAKAALYSLIALLIVIFSVWQTTKSYTNKDDVGKDSLINALKSYKFVTKFKNTDTTDLESVLELKNQFYFQKLQYDTSKNIFKVKNSITRIIKSDIEFSLPSLYQDLAQGTFDPSKYFADTIKEFIVHKNVTLKELALYPGYFNVKGYNNTIENGAIKSILIDSSGFTINYFEVGNFSPTDSSFKKSEEKIRMSVAIDLNNQLKIVNLKYGAPVASNERDQKNKIRIDIFTDTIKSPLQLLMTESILQELKNNSTYYPRKRALTKMLAIQEGKIKRIAGNQIRYNAGEERYANDLQQIIVKATGQTFAKTLVTKSFTKDYLSIFIVEEKSSAK